MPLAELLAAVFSSDSSNVTGTQPKDVTVNSNKNESDADDQTLQVIAVMAPVNSHDSTGPMGWLGSGINSLLKALTGVPSKKDGQVK